LWTAGRVSNEIVAFDTSGEEIEEIDNIPRFGLRMYGFAYWKDDPDNCPLYIFHSPDNQSQMIYKINPDDPETTFVALLEPEEGGTPGGAQITSQFDPYSTVFICIANNGSNDRIDLWQIDARRDWFRIFTHDDEDRIEVDNGVINAGEFGIFTLRFDTFELDTLLYECSLVFRHNAFDFTNVIDISLHVVGEMPPRPFRLIEPADGDTMGDFVEDYIPFEWEPSFDVNLDEISYILQIENDEHRLIYETDSISYPVDLDELIYTEETFTMIWQVQAVAGEDTIYCESPFHFTIPQLRDVIEDEPVPVEFGLHSIYPSPFNSQTTIRFGVDRIESTRLKVYDLLGREVVRLVDDKPSIGYHQVVWDADEFPSGIYIIQLEAEGRIQNAKVALIR